MISFDLSLPLGAFDLQAQASLSESVTAIVGRSGSGKTSLLESIAGLRAARGTISIDDVRLLDTDRGVDLPPEKRRLGLVPQDAALFPHLRVGDNITFAAKDDRRLGELADICSIASLLERFPASLSGGERQRVALARALMSKPRLLLLDEPLSSVEHPLRDRILGALRRIRDSERVPMLYVTHQPFEALAIATYCLMIESGRIVAAGRPRDVLAGDPSSVDAFQNVFEVHTPRADPTQGITRVTTALGMPLVLPFDLVAAADFPLVVRISSEEIVVFGERPSSISSRNVFEGTVETLRPFAGRVDLLVQAGDERIQVRLTQAAANDLALREGLRVWLAMRSRSFRVVG